MRHMTKTIAIAVLSVSSMLVSEPALAFRCGTKLIRDGMHEQQVVARCGQPTTIRHLGRAIRTYDYFSHVRRHGYTYWRSPGFSHLATEVVVTEYVYNFGPRKLMRRLIFEGGVLVTIESIGYGYHD
jgi:hypothetical protein